MDACRKGSGYWRPLCLNGHREGRAARWAAIWVFLADQEEEFLEVVKDSSGEGILEPA